MLTKLTEGLFITTPLPCLRQATSPCTGEALNEKGPGAGGGLFITTPLSCLRQATPPCTGEALSEKKAPLCKGGCFRLCENWGIVLPIPPSFAYITLPVSFSIKFASKVASQAAAIILFNKRNYKKAGRRQQSPGLSIKGNTKSKSQYRYSKCI